MNKSTGSDKINEPTSIKVFLYITRILSLSFLRGFAKFCGLLFYYIIPIRKKVVLQNLSSAFPEKSIVELKSIAKKSYQSMAITFMELIYFPHSTKEQMRKMMNVKKLAEVKKKIDERKGMLFWSAHFGSWEVAAISGFVHLEDTVYVLAKKQSSDFSNHLLVKAREVHGNKMIWMGASVRHIYEVLKKGGVIGIVGDQRGPIDSPRVNFFGRPTAFFSGTAYFILKTKCNVMVGFAIREKDNSYTGYLELLNLENLPQDEKEAIREINQRYANILEKYIRQYPEQYFWMHKLWKY